VGTHCSAILAMLATTAMPSLPFAGPSITSHCRRHLLRCVRFGPSAGRRGKGGSSPCSPLPRPGLRVAPVPLRAFHAARLARPKKTAPEGADAGTGPVDLPGSERHQIMAKKPVTKTAQQFAPRQQPVRQAIIFELVVAHAPHEGLASYLSRTFGFDEVDYHAIRESTEEHVAVSARALEHALNEKAMQIHLQRIVGAFVSSAYGAAMFYGTKLSEARFQTAASTNDHRDEDRDGVAGFESKAQRGRLFAAQMGLQAYALMAAAEGAVDAFVEITGETWKPYEAPQSAPATLARKSADAEMAAFAG
jgi:hypothetical protein